MRYTNGSVTTTKASGTNKGALPLNLILTLIVTLILALLLNSMQ